MFISDLNYLESVDQGDNIQGGSRFSNNKRKRGNGRQNRSKAFARGWGDAKGLGDITESRIDANFIANADEGRSITSIGGFARARS